MMDETSDETSPDGDRRQLSPKQRNLVFGLAAVVLVVAVVAVIFWFSRSDDSDPPPTTVASGGVVLPQNPSLLLVQVDDTWYVENNGNVTMSSVEVRGDSDVVICELGTISPEDRAPCEAAGTADGLTAFGLGPQGQEVQVGST